MGDNTISYIIRLKDDRKFKKYYRKSNFLYCICYLGAYIHKYTSMYAGASNYATIVWSGGGYVWLVAPSVGYIRVPHFNITYSNVFH